jgi:hypothetical protein
MCLLRLPESVGCASAQDSDGARCPGIWASGAACERMVRDVFTSFARRWSEWIPASIRIWMWVVLGSMTLRGLGCSEVDCRKLVLAVRCAGGLQCDPGADTAPGFGVSWIGECLLAPWSPTMHEGIRMLCAYACLE